MPYSILKKFKLNDKTQITANFDDNMNFVLSAPEDSGVYIVSTDNELKRLRGESDILYIGRSGNLRRRLKYLLKHFLPPEFAGNWGRHTARKALKTIFDETNINIFVSYVTCSNNREIETLVLQKYCKNHIETPPLNNQRR